MQTNEIQELLLDTIPAWHYWFARPFKRMLNDGVSLDMYYCCLLYTSPSPRD